MPKALEDCVAKVSGTNKRTGKPYTKSEKFAICNAMMKRKHQAEIEDVNDATLAVYIDEVNTSLGILAQKLMNKGISHEAIDTMCDSILTQAGNDIDNLQYILDKIYT